MTLLRTILDRLLYCRNGGVFLFVGGFVIVAQLVRLALIYKASADLSWDSTLLTALVWGLLFDIGAAALFSLPLVFLLTVLPMHWFAKKWLRYLLYFGVFVILFAAFLRGPCRMDILG